MNRSLILAGLIFGLAILFPVSYLAAGPIVSNSPTSDARPTTRIVSLVPNLTEIAFAINAGEQLVGVSDYCKFPEEAQKLPAVGGLVNPSLEGVLQLRPTVVLLYRSQKDFANRLTQLGIRADLFQVDSLSDLHEAIHRLGTLTGKTSTAITLSGNIKTGLQLVRKQALSNPGSSPVRGVIVVSRDPASLRALYQAGSGNFLGELFKLAGGSLAIKGGAAISLEDVIRANPDLIIDMSGTEAGNETNEEPVQDVGPWAQLPTVSAVRQNQVYQWSNSHAVLLGPSIVGTARQLQQLIENAAKADKAPR